MFLIWQVAPAMHACPSVTVPRPLRFAVVGGTCAGLQIGSLAGLVAVGLPHLLANLLALMLATQVNFVLSATVTWADRPTNWRATGDFARRVAAFNAMCAGTLLLNEGVFAAGERALPYLLAGLLGVAVAAPANYAISHFGIFRTGPLGLKQGGGRCMPFEPAISETGQRDEDAYGDDTDAGGASDESSWPGHARPLAALGRRVGCGRSGVGGGRAICLHSLAGGRCAGATGAGAGDGRDADEYDYE